MAHSYTNLLTHIVFSTKSRAPLIDEQLKPRLLAYMTGIVREVGGTSLAINSVADHVHLLLRLRASNALADAMRVLKTNSSRWVHETWPQRRTFAWQTGYAAFSVSQSNVEDVRAYIAGQEEHHRKVTFQDELFAFLNKNGIEYDERYIWE